MPTQKGKKKSSKWWNCWKCKKMERFIIIKAPPWENAISFGKEYFEKLLRMKLEILKQQTQTFYRWKQHAILNGKSYYQYLLRFCFADIYASLESEIIVQENKRKAEHLHQWSYFSTLLFFFKMMIEHIYKESLSRGTPNN